MYSIEQFLKFFSPIWLRVTVHLMEGLGPHIPVTLVADGAHTLADLFLRRVQSSGQNTAFFDKLDGEWRATSWSAWKNQAWALAQGIIESGCTPGDRVAILGPTRPEWAICEIAVQLAGCVSVGIYPKQSSEQVEYILAHSEARLIFVDSNEELATVIEAAEDLSTLKWIIPWPRMNIPSISDPRLKSFSELIAVEARSPMKEHPGSARQSAKTAMFVYTSGTTGPPKCAMISHDNILSVLSVQDDILDFYEDDLSLSFLPMAHVAERILAFYGRICAGIATAYATNIAAVLDELKEVQPTIFGSVPRIFEKAFARIESEIEQMHPAVQNIFKWADQIGRQRIRLLLSGAPIPFSLRLQFAFADRLVFQKIRAAFGGRVRHFLTGAAPIPLHILEFFWAAGLPIYECYGQTEATVLTHANTPARIKLGTVGQIAKGLEQRIADDGEILIKGPFVFQGYYKDLEATRDTIIDGWLHTGDIGTIDDEGYLTITDRKKHIMITAGGKNLTPANISKAIKSMDSLISHVHPHADRRPYVCALVALSPIETLDFGLRSGVIDQDIHQSLMTELISNPTGRSENLSNAMARIATLPEICERIVKAVSRGNTSLSQVEKIKRFIILNRDFSQEAGELTPTMKMRRKNIEVAYAETFERIYSDQGYALKPEDS